VLFCVEEYGEGTAEQPAIQTQHKKIREASAGLDRLAFSPIGLSQGISIKLLKDNKKLSLQGRAPHDRCRP
jgi:hypothetical protein